MKIQCEYERLSLHVLPWQVKRYLIYWSTLCAIIVDCVYVGGEKCILHKCYSKKRGNMLSLVCTVFAVQRFFSGKRMVSDFVFVCFCSTTLSKGWRVSVICQYRTANLLLNATKTKQNYILCNYYKYLNLWGLVEGPWVFEFEHLPFFANIVEYCQKRNSEQRVLCC